jgi:hypothetical protein
MDVFDRFTAKAYVPSHITQRGANLHCFSSDPIIEPMLQSVPDPFDSYGPPQAEDQIFSILPPLSIMTNAPSPSPSSLTSTPEHDIIEVLPTQSSRNAPWIPNNNGSGIFSSESTEWAEVPSPSSTPPRSVSPPSHRKHSTPSAGHHLRKSESKLRSVLSVIDETHARQTTEADTHPEATSSSNGTIRRTDTGPDTSWGSFTYGQSPYVDADNNEPTLQHPTPLSPQSHLPLPNVGTERNESDGNVPILIAT